MLQSWDYICKGKKYNQAVKYFEISIKEASKESQKRILTSCLFVPKINSSSILFQKILGGCDLLEYASKAKKVILLIKNKVVK